MVRNTFALFRVRGITVGVHISWLIVFGLVTWSLATGFLPALAPLAGRKLDWHSGSTLA